MQELISFLKALADETRLKIINLLLSHDFCVKALAKQLKLSEAAVSQHLQVLRRVGLVKGEKKGYWTHYSVQKDILYRIGMMIRELADQTTQPGNNEKVLRDKRCIKKGGKEPDGTG